jgi:hypothetical protein
MGEGQPRQNPLRCMAAKTLIRGTPVHHQATQSNQPKLKGTNKVKTNKTKKYYRISREDRGEYSHIHIDIVHGSRSLNDEVDPANNSLTLRFQSHAGSNEWYGGRFSIAARTLGGLKAIQRIAALLCRDSNCLGTLKETLEVLELAGYQRAVYDLRRSEFVPVKAVLPPDHVRWLAKGSSCYAAVVAPADDHHHARRLLEKEVADYSLANFEKWVLEGKPVQVDTFSTAPVNLEVNLDPI